MTWQLQEAKNKFSKVVEDALSEGPQIVTRRGVETVVVMSMDEYRNLNKSDSDLVTFFRESPLYGVELDIDRREKKPRTVEL